MSFRKLERHIGVGTKSGDFAQRSTSTFMFSRRLRGAGDFVENMTKAINNLPDEQLDILSKKFISDPKKQKSIYLKELLIQQQSNIFKLK